jgi:Ran GTPase-activating protein (RanGAP) involved in mRNA processing and transport
VRTQNPQTLLARYARKTASAKKASKKSKRKHNILEVYSDNYYKSKLQGMVNEELNDDPQYAALPRNKKHAHQLSVYLRIRANCWKNESDEVKAEIQQIFDNQGDEENEENESESDDDGGDDEKDDDEKALLQRQQE